MGKLRTCEKSGTCSHKARNLIVVSAIIGALLMGLAVTTFSESPPPATFTYTIGNENWEAQTSLHSGSVAGQSYVIPSEVTTGNLPSYVMGTPTSSNLQIDADYAPGTVTIYVGAASAQAPATGPKPKVIISLSQVVPTDNTGQPIGEPVAAKEWDDTTGATQLHWYQYYFYFEASMKTESAKCNKPFGYGYPGDFIKNSYCGVLYEYEVVPVTMSFSVDLMSIYQNASFQSKLGDARVTYVKLGYIPSSVTVNSFETSYDYAAQAFNDLDINNKVNPTYEITQGSSDTSAVLTLSGNLQSGMIMDHDGNAIYGISMPVNVYLIYGVLFSVQVSRPLTQAQRAPEAAYISIIDYLIAVMQNPSDPIFWVIILIVVVVVVMLIPKKKAAQAVQQHFHFGGRKPEPGF